MGWKSDLSLLVLSVIGVIHVHGEECNDTCSSALSLIIKYVFRLDNITEVPLEKAEELMPYLNTQLVTVFYTFGFEGLPNGTATETIISTYCSLGSHNVILVNWTIGASNPYPTAFAGYTFYAVQNAVKIGKALGVAIVKLVKLGLDPTKIHLIGLSLGAQLMGYAGRKVKELGYQLYRATGLDPAGLYFDTQINYTPINQDSARFVDILHTDIGHCGMRTATGHVDFFFNAGNYEVVFTCSVQPGCDKGFKLCGNLCSHNRSVYYWAEALKYIRNFLAGLADSYQKYVEANGIFKITNYVGPLCNSSLPGKYYLSTNVAPLYGRQEAGLKPTNEC